MEFVDFTDDTEQIHSDVLQKGQEWTVQVPSGATLTLTVKYGIVEILGTELATDIPYKFQGTIVSIFSVERSKLEWKCPEDLEPQLSTDIQYHTYVYNLHFALERLRLSSFNGPRVLILGESSTGKSSLAHILCSYALKSKQYQPLLVNLNPQAGLFSVPSSITATPISDLLDVESSLWGQSITTGATKLHNKQPLVKNFGLENIRDNRPLYLETVSQLAVGVQHRLKNDPIVRRSGVIIDTPMLSHLDSESWLELNHIMNEFDVNAIVVCAVNDDLAITLSEVFRSKAVSIVRIPPPSSILKVDDVTRRSIQRLQIREYFYGNSQTILSPYTIGAGYEDLSVLKPKNLSELGDNTENINMLALDPVEVTSSNLQHAIVAITNVSKKSSLDTISKSSIVGYALITEMNDSKRKLRILLPLPSRMPDRAMILTEYRYLE